MSSEAREPPRLRLRPEEQSLKLLRAALAMLALSPLAAHAGEQAAQVFAQVSGSVFTVLAQTPAGAISQGSAVVVGPAHLVTNHHVIAGATVITLRHGQDQFTAVVESEDALHDLAVLRAETLGAPPVAFGGGDDVRVGQTVYAVGSPRGLEQSLSEGIVASLRAVNDGVMIQTTAPISPGSSGGGLFDEHGRLIGVTTMQAVNSQNLNFAIPVGWLARLGVNVATADAGLTAPPPPPAAPVAPAVAIQAPPAAPPSARAGPLPTPGVTATAAPAAATPAGRGRLMLVTALIIGMLVGARPAVNWLADAMSNMNAMPSPRRAAGKPVIDRVMPFRKAARDEIAAGKRDAALWDKALGEAAGDEQMAAAAYVELRAQALYKADLDRKWAAAKAQSAGAVPPRR